MKLKISFILKSGTQENLPIIALISYGYKELNLSKNKYVYLPLRYYTGEQTTLKEWDKTESKPKAKTLKDRLIILEKQIRDTYQFLTHNLIGEILEPKRLKSALDEKIKGKIQTDVKRIRIVDFLEHELLKDKTIKINSISRFRSFKNILEEFENVNNRKVYLNDVNDEFYKVFMNAYKSREKVKKNNSVWGFSKVFTGILNRIGRKYNISVYNPSLKLNPKERVKKINEEKIYLNFQQVKTILEHETESGRMENIRIILLTLLFTGVRYSDVFKVRHFKHFEKGGIEFDYCELITSKTDKAVAIPILKPLAESFAKNGGVAMYVNETIFNTEVKILMKNCGFTEKITLPYTDQNGKKAFESKCFYDFVSSHIGRRSFITNLIQHVPITILTKITTHEIKDSSLIFMYNKSGIVENAYQLMKTLKRTQQDDREHFIFDLV